MIGARTSAAHCVQYELEVSINAPCEQVWQAITEETNAWWLPEFHMVGEGSRITFEIHAGGRLVEHLEGGASLLWYTVHCIRPDQFTVYLVGQVAPDWGGPATSHLKLAVEEQSNAGGCVLKVTDALHGLVDDTNIKSLYDGWKQLFSDGLQAFVERGIRQE